MKDIKFLHKDSFDYEKYVDMVKKHHKDGDILSWFDYIYDCVEGDYTKVFWADLEPNPYLVDWLKQKLITKQNKTACVIGCGVGDDAEILSKYGYKVTAFDISQSAINLCKNRYPNTKVTYLVADLFNYPKEWFENFDVVYECNTIQVLPNEYRKKARVAMSSLIAKDGYILVSCRSREENTMQEVIPLPLSKSEMDEFVSIDGLKQISFEAYDDTQEPAVPHFWGVYKKS
jgi:2-polyprenyl-3-methyl-5-hydroxy-6-metoxy-1,4-benzoquinol methylase